MRLYLCEKPNQGKDVARVLGATQSKSGYIVGNGITVTWALGHLLETAPPEGYGEQYKKWSLDQLPIIPDKWKMEVVKKTAAQFAIVKQLLAQASELVIATDSDREGEMIARELLDYCHYRGPVKRLWFSALNDASIRKALNEIKDGAETYPLYQAACGRSRADWLIGMNLSRFFTLKGRQSGYDGVLSIGRVQTPTLRIVIEREREIKNFISVPYWTIDVDLHASNQSFKAEWLVPESHADKQGRCIHQTNAQQVHAYLQSNRQANVTSIETERVQENHPLLFDMNELQKVCSAKWGYGAQETLDIAQNLYEKHKILTYPRTECGYLPDSMQSEVPAVLSAIAKSNPALVPLISTLDPTLKSRAWNDKKVGAESHHGIIPTEKPADYAALIEKEKNVYDLACRRYMAQFAPLHEFDRTTVRLACGQHILQAIGRRIVVAGWKAVMVSEETEGEGTANAGVLPPLQEHMICHIQNVQLNAKKTTPPALYTEGTLIEAMKNVAKFVENKELKQKLSETKGIGTGATRAGIIKGLLDRGYILKKGRSLIGSDAAHTLIDALPKAISDPATTAIWEQALDAIAKERLTLESFVQKQSIWITQILDSCKDLSLNIKVPDGPPCPLCQTPMQKRHSKNGPFWACPNYPDCTGTLPISQRKQTKTKYNKRPTQKKSESSV